MENTNNTLVAGMRGGLTEADIFAAADEIYATGKRPTQVLIREKLGGGSFATIGPALKKWRTQQQECKNLENEDLPLELNAFLQQLGGKIWKTALALAESRLTAERKSLSQIQEQIESELSDQNDAIKKLEMEALHYKRQIADKDESIENLQISINKLEFELCNKV